MRKMDNYSRTFGKLQEDEFYKEILEIGEESSWSEHKTSEIQFIPLTEENIETTELIYGIDSKILEDTLLNSGIMVDIDGERHCVRNDAIQSIQGVIGLSGSALKYMNKENLVHCYNLAAEAVKNQFIMQERSGKINTFHTQRYNVVPATKVYEITTETADKLLGEMEFQRGWSSHSYTEAQWILSDCADDVRKAYANIMNSAVSKYRSESDVLPTMRMGCSDVGKNTIVCNTALRIGKVNVPINNISVKHMNSAEKRYREETSNLFAMRMTESLDWVEMMSKIEIRNIINCFIAVCNQIDIGYRWGAPALERHCSRFGDGACSAFDIYLSIYEILNDMTVSGKLSKVSLLTKQECFARMRVLSWPKYDIYGPAGTITWKNKKGDD